MSLSNKLAPTPRQLALLYNEEIMSRRLDGIQLRVN